MSWEEHIIEKPTVQIQVQTPAGPWALRGHPWLVLAVPGNPGWRAPAEDSAALALLSAPLPNRTSLSALCEGLAPAILATVGEITFNADAQIGERGNGFLGPLLALHRLAPAVDEVGWAMVEHDNTQILVIGTDTWRLLIAQLRAGSIYRFVDDRPVASVAHALGVPQQEWGQLLKLIQQQTQALRRLRRSLAEARDTAQELLDLSAEPSQLWTGSKVAAQAQDAAELRRAERDEARAELARLREQTTPRTYQEGDRPRLPEMVLWRSEGVWAPLHRDCLRPGDRWLPMPPRPVET